MKQRYFRPKAFIQYLLRKLNYHHYTIKISKTAGCMHNYAPLTRFENFNSALKYCNSLVTTLYEHLRLIHWATWWSNVASHSLHAATCSPHPELIQQWVDQTEAQALPDIWIGRGLINFT